MTTAEPAAELSAALRRAYDDWWAALPAHDEAALDAILADDWTYVDQFGSIRNKREYIDLVKRVIRPDHSTVVVELSARPLETCAVATGRYDVTGVIEGLEVNLKLRFTSVWHNRDGR